MKRNDRTTNRLLAALLLVATVLAYLPCLRGNFLWDDDAYISQNPALTSVQGLRDIWFNPGSVQQYYPVTFTLFWIEYHLWGLNPLGYHAVNILLHGLNALLFWIILDGLGFSGAWIAAWLFALHPVMVESVAWMTELKNVLSTFFYLLTAICLRKSWKLAIPVFLCALLSKSVTVTLPVSFLLISGWMIGSRDKKEMLQMLPLIGVGIGAACFTIYFEHHLVRAQGTPWDFSFAQRVLIAGRAFWFYLAKLMYPSPLVFIYPRWTVNPHDVFQYAYPAAIPLLFIVLAYGQRWWGKIPFACFLFFAISLGPALGFSSFYFMRYSFVADHFQYLASMGLYTLAAWLLSRMFEKLEIPLASPLSVIVIGLLCLDLALATTGESRKFADTAGLWEQTLTYNPDSAIAHHNLGIALSQKGQWRLAIAHLRTAEALDPSFAQTHLALAYFAVNAKRWADARHQYEEAIRLGVRDPQILKDFAALPK